MRSALLLALLLAPCLACARGLGGATPAGGPGPLPSGGVPRLAGLAAAAPGPGACFVEWRLPAPPAEAALFVSTDRALVYAGPPAREALGEGGTLVDGLADGVVHHFGLGVRATPAEAYVPAGAVLSARPGTPLFVDPGADPAVADGATPRTAFPDLASALLTALADGGGNVWALSGTYAEGNLPLATGVHLYGGFGPGFLPEERQPGGTRILAQGTSVAIGVRDATGAEGTAIVDGVALEGEGGASVGIDVSDASFELRSVSVTGFAGRGVRAREPGTGGRDASLVGCTLLGNGADGLSLAGSWDVLVDGCEVSGNAQEGMELDDLVAPTGRTSRLVVRGSRFAANGTEGLDADLVAGFPPLPPAGAFDVRVVGCLFEHNGADGLLVDQDHEDAPGWSAAVSIEGCTSRANRGSGVRLDADAEGSHALVGCLLAANASDGLRVDAETTPGLVTLVATVASGNLGAGVRSEETGTASTGTRPVLLSHCVLSGNGAGGLVVDDEFSGVASSVAWLQPSPWDDADARGSLVESDPLAGTFRRVPEGFGRIVGLDGERLLLDDTTAFPPGATVELEEDGVARTVARSDSAGVALEDGPPALVAPASIAVFDFDADVREDYALPPGSDALGAGLAPPGATADAGPAAAPYLAGVPAVGRARDDAVRPFVPLATEPPPTVPLAPAAVLRVRFSAALDPAALAATPPRVLDALGAELAVDARAVDDALELAPPPGGWPAGRLSVELFAGLGSSSGPALAGPFVLSLVASP